MKKYRLQHKHIYFFLVTLMYIPRLTATLTIRSIYDLMTENPNITYQKCFNPIPFAYKKFPLAHHDFFHPNKGCFDQSGIFTIPNGIICDHCGDLILYNQNTIIKEFLGTHFSLYKHIEFLNFKTSQSTRNIKKINGKVAVVRSIGSNIYGHWIGELLAKIALLQIKNIEYDWLYLICNQPYIQEIVQLLAIDSSKIIQDSLHDYDIQAEELIIPSLPARFIPMHDDHNYANQHYQVLYIPQWHIQWLQQLFIPVAEQKIAHTYPDKIFISRKDTDSRKIINEDELFSYFKKKGFYRYQLSELSFLEQVRLFSQATCIVSPHGSGLTNIIFCKPNTCIIEIYQNQFDPTFWYISDTLHLDHHCIKTQGITSHDRKIDTHISIDTIQNYINQHVPNV